LEKVNAPPERTRVMIAVDVVPQVVFSEEHERSVRAPVEHLEPVPERPDGGSGVPAREHREELIDGALAAVRVRLAIDVKFEGLRLQKIAAQEGTDHGRERRLETALSGCTH